MVSNQRAQFTTRLGFILAAAGSAVGLGNIWGFPTQAASNGGAVFLLTYLAMVFILAYPLLVAELTIGRFGASNPIRALISISPTKKKLGWLIGLAGMLAVSAILSFYAIVAGWFFGNLLAPLLTFIGFPEAATWLLGFSEERNILLMAIFMLLTILVVKNGVTEGIEKWSTRLMPILFVLFFSLVVYTLTQEGAVDGLKMYIVPDTQYFTPDLVVSAMGQAFFSLSIGVCSMMVYGSYLKPDANLPKTAAQVALLDTSVAFIAGLLILPAMFVAQNNGVTIFSEKGDLIGSSDLVFTVLPALFDSMGNVGVIIGFAFFALMVIAALTSSISMLEVPVACMSEELKQPRAKTAWLIGLTIAAFSTLIIFNFDALFGLVITITTEYMQPILGMIIALMAGWLWHRNQILEELRKGWPEISESFFWKIWPFYIRIVCPVLMLLVFIW